MAWLICGTVPDDGFPLSRGRWQLAGSQLEPVGADGRAVCKHVLDVRRGTPALAAACLLTCAVTGAEPPELLLAGDIGDGKGSAALYLHLAKSLSERSGTPLNGVTFHYLFPDVDGHNRVFMAFEKIAEQGRRPLLVADAGFMYVAKMSGYAGAYDLFTPDAGELAFLADEKAPHPFYTRGFLLDEERNVDELVHRAQAHGNCARNLLVKGAVDCVASGGEITDRIANPCVPNMEPIGGTGDLLTGVVTGLLASGVPMRRACVAAAKANRFTGELARPTPATQVSELLHRIPEALRLALRD